MTAPEPLAPPRAHRAPSDYTVGCGQPPAEMVNGRICAGTGTEPSCQLCPHSPSYWRRTYAPITTEETKR